MNVRSEQLDSHVITLVATIEPEDYREEYKVELKKSRKALNLKGFRPGQVPMAVAERMIGPRVRMDLVQQKLDQAISSYLQDNELSTYSRFIPSAEQEFMDIEGEEGTYTFRLDVGILPNLAEEILPRMVVFEPQVDEAYVQEQLDEQRSLHGKELALEQVEEGCTLRLRFAPQGDQEEDKAVERQLQYADLGQNAQAALRGKGIDFTMDVESLADFLPEDAMRSRLFPTGANGDAFEGAMRVNLMGIHRRELAQADEELYRSVVPLRPGEEEPKDIEGWQKLYRSRQQEKGEYWARSLAVDAFYKQVATTWDYLAPSSFVRRMVEHAEEGNKIDITDDLLAYYQQQLKEDGVEKQLASRLDMDKLREQMQEDGFVRFLAAKAIRQQGLRMGLPPSLYDSIDRTIAFGFSMYGEGKLQEIIAPIQWHYMVGWESMRRAGYDVRSVSIHEFSDAASKEYEEVATQK